MSISKIKTEKLTLEERGRPKDSYFHIVFHEGTERKEHDTNWSDFSENKKVDYMGGKKSVNISKYKIKHIKMFHGLLKTEMDVPDDCEVYQAVRAETIFIPNGNKIVKIHGRVVGLIKNNEVQEERFLNGTENVVLGWRK